MTPAQAKTLDRAVQDLVSATVCDSWKGSQELSDHAEIELDLLKAKTHYETLLKKLTTPEE